MTRINRIVTSQVEGRTLSDQYADNSMSYDENGKIYYYGENRMGPLIGPGVVYGSNADSSDGYGLDTLKLIPNAPDGFPQDDRYLVIDPTSPNHIHIRAGGTQDASNAQLFLGAEETYVMVSDGNDSVDILANNISINSNAVPSALNINTYLGAVVNSARTSVYNPEDRIVATLGDLQVGIADAEPVETVFTVNGGTLGTQPTFNGAPLFTGSYVKHGPMVHFQIQVDMDNITSFGTGQYFVDLPFPAKYGYQVREGCLHDVSTGHQYSIGGHVYANQSRLNLSFTNSNGQDEVFDFNSPINLTTEDNFHISGSYITVE